MKKIVNEVYLDIYKLIYKDIFLTGKDSLLLDEFKKYIKEEENNFIKLFEEYKGISFDKYEKKSLRKEKLGNTLFKLFKGNNISEEEHSIIKNSTADEKINALELVSFSKLRQTNKNKLENFMDNNRIIKEIKAENEYIEYDLSFPETNYITQIVTLGNAMIDLYQGKILDEKSLKTIASATAQDKLDAIVLCAPQKISLKREKVKK